jgi:hypothetical protein
MVELNNKVTYQLPLTITLRYELIHKVKDLSFSELYLIQYEEIRCRHMRYTRIQTTEQNYQKIGKGNSSVATLNIIVTLRICIFQQ